MEIDTDNVGWSEFTPELTMNVGAVPQGMAENYIRQAAKQFCIMTNMLRVQQYSDMSPDGVVDFDIPEGWAVSRVLQVVIPWVLRRDYEISQQHYKIINERTALMLHGYPIPMTMRGLKVVFSIFPTDKACTCPRWFFDKFGMTIISGASGYILRIADKSIADPQRSALFLQEFQSGIQQAQMDRVIGAKATTDFQRGRMFF